MQFKQTEKDLPFMLDQSFKVPLVAIISGGKSI